MSVVQLESRDCSAKESGMRGVIAMEGRRSVAKAEREVGTIGLPLDIDRLFASVQCCGNGGATTPSRCRQKMNGV